jgi:hypothetical protein
MSIRKINLAIPLLLLMACGDNMTDDPIPLASFPDIVIDLSLPSYVALRTSGGYKEVNGGVRGIIVHRSIGTSFQAYERNCSFHPNEACATVNVHTSGLYLTDPCCGSTFSFDDGTPTGGVAWRPLRMYRTQFSGSILTISDEVIN